MTESEQEKAGKRQSRGSVEHTDGDGGTCEIVFGERHVPSGCVEVECAEWRGHVEQSVVVNVPLTMLADVLRANGFTVTWGSE